MNILTFFIALAVFFILDVIWIGFVAKNFYRKQIGFLLADTVNWMAAVSFYLLFVAGLVFFVIHPALQAGVLMHALVHGALFGLVTYASYDLTNLALTKDWPLRVTLIDLCWGVFLSASVSSVTFLVVSAL